MTTPGPPDPRQVADSAQDVADVPAAWKSLDIATAGGDTFPDVESGAHGWQPCFLFRGRENWLGRFARTANRGETREAIRAEARALAAQWLKVENAAVLLGAGASWYATKFVGREMFDRIRASLKGSEEKKTLDHVLKYVGAPDKVGKDFESFLTQLSMLVPLIRGGTAPFDALPFQLDLGEAVDRVTASTRLENLLVAIEQGIIDHCRTILPPSALAGEGGDLTPHEAFLAKLVARGPQQGRARIFTTNYDTLAEQAMDRLGILYCDGFTGTVARRFNPAAYSLDLHYPGEATEGPVRRYDKVLHLYKLHGSINWRKAGADSHAPYGVTFDAGSPNLRRDTGDVQRLAILPTASKYGETLEMPFAHVFRLMAQTLLAPQTVLFVVGYSGWDAHVNQIVEDALANPGFTCVIVDPRPSEWAQRLCFADYCGRVYCFGGEWGTFEFFARQLLPDLDVLKTEIAIAKTLRELKDGRDRGDSTDRSHV
jgi:hypothetical protein